MQEILFVSHCILNTASKVVLYNQEEIESEEALRQRFLLKAIEKGVQLIQLPCPEFAMYGAMRWGHVSNQFDNPFFRDYCKKSLEPIFLQMEEYLAHGERFHVMGVLGVDGSPSCGVDYTCKGNWYGSFGCRENLQETLASVKLESGKGILMDVLEKELQARGWADSVPMVGLFASEPEKCMSFLEKL